MYDSGSDSDSEDSLWGGTIEVRYQTVLVSDMARGVSSVASLPAFPLVTPDVSVSRTLLSYPALIPTWWEMMVLCGKSVP